MTPPSAQQVCDAYNTAVGSDPERYSRLHLQDFFWGYLLGYGLSGAEALEYMGSTQLGET